MLCPNCFGEKENKTCCPSCKYDELEECCAVCLPYRTVLAERYAAGNSGRFRNGMVYLAWSIKLATKVAVKEFFPRSLVNREKTSKQVKGYTRQSTEDFNYGKEQFLKEAQALAKFDHAHLVRVMDMFEENGTAYIVMEYYEGVNLEEHIIKVGGKLSVEAVKNIMIPIMDGLKEVHRHNIIHRDIKPQNIYLSSKGRPILLDFGAARQAIQNQNQSNSVVLTEGFAPYERYSRKGDQGAHTDVYGCAATMYYLLTGLVPQDTLDGLQKDDLRPLAELLPDIAPRLSLAIEQAMAVLPRDRTKTIGELQEALLLKENFANQTELLDLQKKLK